jgi:membrane-associated phospholipid phosphatase
VNGVSARRLWLLPACMLLVGLLALQVWIEGPMTRIDQQVTLWLAANRYGGLTRAMLFLSAAHQTEKLLGVAALLAAWLAVRRDWRLALRLLVIPVGMLLNVALKHLFMRPRPQLDEPLVQLATFSFPSGHAVASTVFYGSLCALAFARWRGAGPRATAVLAAMLMVLLVTFSRVYLGAHYLSDVVAGVAVGAICLVLFLVPQRSPAPGQGRQMLQE